MLIFGIRIASREVIAGLSSAYTAKPTLSEGTQMQTPTYVDKHSYIPSA